MRRLLDRHFLTLGALLLAACSASSDQDEASVRPGEGGGSRPAIEASPAGDSDPFVPQANAGTREPAFSEQVEPRLWRGEESRREPVEARNGVNDSKAEAVVPQPSTNPYDPDVVSRRGGTGIERNAPADPTTQIVGGISGSNQPPTAPPSKGGFVITGPVTVLEQDGVTPATPNQAQP